jgi:hypothetical protein
MIRSAGSPKSGKKRLSEINIQKAPLGGSFFYCLFLSGKGLSRGLLNIQAGLLNIQSGLFNIHKNRSDDLPAGSVSLLKIGR